MVLKSGETIWGYLVIPWIYLLLRMALRYWVGGRYKVYTPEVKQLDPEKGPLSKRTYSLPITIFQECLLVVHVRDQHSKQ